LGTLARNEARGSGELWRSTRIAPGRSRALSPLPTR
jgi:hypothetical protein